MKTPTITKYAWLPVLGAAMAISTWSLFYVGAHEGAPWPIAGLISVCIDGATLLCADYALKYARIGESGAGPRFCVYLFGAASIYINSMHAAIAGQPPFARILWAVPPVVAILVYERYQRWEKRMALARQRKTNAPLPSLGLLAWILRPIFSFKTIRATTSDQLERTLLLYAPRHFTRITGSKYDSISGVSETDEEFPVTVESSDKLVSIESPSIRAWARMNGYPLGERGPIPQNAINAYYRAQIETSREENES